MRPSRKIEVVRRRQVDPVKFKRIEKIRIDETGQPRIARGWDALCAFLWEVNAKYPKLFDAIEA